LTLRALACLRLEGVEVLRQEDRSEIGRRAVSRPADRQARVSSVAANPSPDTSFEQLSEREIAALVDASSWYAKYHERMIAELADDRSAMAVARRERFGVSALRPLEARCAHAAARRP